MINKILENYKIEGKLVKVEENKSGNINKTYVVTFLNNDKEQKYLVQRINNSVFNEPYKLMKNIDGVTTFINKRLAKAKDIKHWML